MSSRLDLVSVQVRYFVLATRENCTVLGTEHSKPEDDGPSSTNLLHCAGNTGNVVKSVLGAWDTNRVSYPVRAL